MRLRNPTIADGKTEARNTGRSHRRERGAEYIFHAEVLPCERPHCHVLSESSLSAWRSRGTKIFRRRTAKENIGKDREQKSMDREFRK